MEAILLVVILILLSIIYPLYTSKKEDERIISRLKDDKYSLEQELNNSAKTVSDISKQLTNVNNSLKTELTKSKSLNIVSDSLSERLNVLANENVSFSERLNVVSYLNKSLNERLQEVIHQKNLVELNLSKAQLSHLKMAQSIQSEFDETMSDAPKKFTYIASLMADYLTLNIEKAEKDLGMSDKSHERQRAKKVNEIRAETKEILTKYKEAQYQLDYLLQIYPELNDVINSDALNNLSFQEINDNYEIFNDDPISRYISRSEWEELTQTERNQLALERYLARPKSNWEIGRDYELYIAYIYELKGYSVDTFGSYMRINDLGRDLIAKKGNKTEVIQCKYWSTKKEIHENHICQLFGTVICYCIENNLSIDDVEAVFITSTVLSKKAKEFSDMLKIKVIENIPLKDFPRIKCNIGHDEWGQTKIYHLPIDPLYDKVKISKKEECYCSSVYKAEDLGFRRAYKWHGN